MGKIKHWRVRGHSKEYNFIQDGLKKSHSEGTICSKDGEERLKQVSEGFHSTLGP